MVRRFAAILQSIPLWCAICLICAGVMAWTGRNVANPDGVSYLDLASQFLAHGPVGLVNAYWSPGYPFVLSLASALFRPSPEHEFPLAHLVNFAIFALALWAFSSFLRSWSALNFPGNLEERRPLLVPVAYATFLFFSLNFIGLEPITPDLLVAAMVFLAAGITCRIAVSGSAVRHYVELGAVLGLAYYVKAAMLLIGLALIVILFVFPPAQTVYRKKLAMGVLVWLVLIFPLIAVTSARVGRLSIGETGRLNYAWMVNNIRPFAGWTGDPTGADGVPLHPPRKLLEKPEVLEFASPVNGTCPLWFDPSYWYAGLKVRFSPDRQINALKTGFNTLTSYFLDPPFLLYSVLALWLFGLRTRARTPLQPQLWQLAWATAALFIYAAVWLEKRYIGAFFVLIWLALFSIGLRRVSGCVAAFSCAVLAAILVIPTAFMTAIAPTVRANIPLCDEAHYKMIGRELHFLGIGPGDRVAVVGSALEAYYARYAGVQVAAQITSEDDFWSVDLAHQLSIANRLRAVGVKAIVARNRPHRPEFSNWLDVPIPHSQTFSILRLSDVEQTSPLRSVRR